MREMSDAAIKKQEELSQQNFDLYKIDELSRTGRGVVRGAATTNESRRKPYWRTTVEAGSNNGHTSGPVAVSITTHPVLSVASTTTATSTNNLRALSSLVAISNASVSGISVPSTFDAQVRTDLSTMEHTEVFEVAVASSLNKSGVYKGGITRGPAFGRYTAVIMAFFNLLCCFIRFLLYTGLFQLPKKKAESRMKRSFGSKMKQFFGLLCWILFVNGIYRYGFTPATYDGDIMSVNSMVIPSDPTMYPGNLQSSPACDSTTIGFFPNVVLREPESHMSEAPPPPLPLPGYTAKSIEPQEIYEWIERLNYFLFDPAINYDDPVFDYVLVHRSFFERQFRRSLSWAAYVGGALIVPDVDFFEDPAHATILKLALFASFHIFQ